MIKILQNINREDLETLWKLVKAKHKNTRPDEAYERVLWGDLKVMFELDIESDGRIVGIKRLHNDLGVNIAKVRVTAAKHNLLPDIIVHTVGEVVKCCLAAVVRRCCCSGCLVVVGDCCQVKCLEEETEIVPLSYHLGHDIQIQFGREKFCLVTGLRFGLVLLGLEDRRKVPDWILRLANVRDDWDMYPWGCRPTPTLTPNEFEARSDWWVSSRGYFDGHIREPARISRHVNQHTQDDVLVDYYRRLEEHDRALKELMQKDVARE
ncbi:hypothetical protein Tco_0741401 [Tanacetum coccineum]